MDVSFFDFVGTKKATSDMPATTVVNADYLLHSCGSVPSLCSGAAGDNIMQHSAASLDCQNIPPPLVSYFVNNSAGSGVTMLNKSGQGEDLYTWMAKQGFEDADTKVTESKVAKSTFWVRKACALEKRLPAGQPQDVRC